MASLININKLEDYMKDFIFPYGEQRQEINRIINNWQKSFLENDLQEEKETSLDGEFLSDFFCKILGYQTRNEGCDVWTLSRQLKSETDGTEADGALGFYNKFSKNTRCVIELKDAKCNLDAKQPRKNNQTPVEQAFQYLTKNTGCDWAIVSNYKEIRLYYQKQNAYELFDVMKLHEEPEFKRFYFCLCKQNLLNENKNSIMDNLLKDSTEHEKQVTDDFYKDYKKLRQTLFEHICENNPGYDKKWLLEKTQKLLDRLIFIMFCEDSKIQLLQPETIKKNYEIAINYPDNSDEKVYRIMKNLFISINEGNYTVNPPINKYNGGMFAEDKDLDNLIIKDFVWKDVVELANYKFESDLNVNILGHIFEKSIKDLEKIKNEIDGIVFDAKKSQQKKDGVFYTPEYITKYIIEQTVGRYLEEHPDKLETIKILDPACGSGAFLNQAHSFLKQIYQNQMMDSVNKTKSSRRGGQEYLQLELGKHQNIFEIDSSILLNNLFGVDLNKESVEITKLALWLKTAKKDKPLQNLDANIKCGNSLIDDQNIVGEKAFKWDKEFKEIIDNGGFDVIIGNPPYVKARENKDFASRRYIEKEYKSAKGMWDLYVPFVERGLSLLKQGGYLGMIIPDTIGSADYTKDLVELIERNYDLVQIDFFPDVYIFENVGVKNKIIIIKNTKNNKVNTKRIRHGYNLTDIEILDEISDLSKYKLNRSNVSFDKVPNLKLGDICYVSYGLRLNSDSKDTEYSFKKGDLISLECNEVNNRPYIEGKYIDRYKFNKTLFVEWGTSRCPSRLVRPTFPELYNVPRVLLSRQKRIATYTDKNYVCDNTIIMAILAKDLSSVKNRNIDKYYNNLNLPRAEIENNSHNYNLKYILAILNSKLIHYFIQNNAKGNIDFYPDDWKSIPIYTATMEEQHSLAQKAAQLIELNGQLQACINSGIELIKSEFKPKALSQNLEKYYELGFEIFIQELKKQKVKIPNNLSQKEELINWYNKKAEEIMQIQQQINNVDDSIDSEVYKLYGLNPDEIKIIECQLQ